MREKDSSDSARLPVNVVKVGGAVVEDSAALHALLGRFARMEGAKVLAHGGGRTATRLAARLGIESRMVGGRRVTDEETLRVVTMVYAGLVNKNVVAALQALGVNAAGLTGADMGLILSHRRPPARVADGEGEREVDFGHVGDVDRVDAARLERLLEWGVVPVVAPLTHDGRGGLLNTNADTIAAQVAQALAPGRDVTLTYCFEKAGVLRDPGDERSVIPSITLPEYRALKADGVIAGGMVPKLDNAFRAIARGVRRVVITRSDDPGGERGTVIH